MNEDKDTISVKKLIELVLLKGGLSSGWTGANRSITGINIHKRVQKSRTRGYEKEVPLSYHYKKTGTSLIITGRVDGIFTSSVPVVVEEIKSTVKNVDSITFHENHRHSAQVQLYGYLYAHSLGLTKVTLQLTYINIYNFKTKEITETFSFTDLKVFFYRIMALYFEWKDHCDEWRRIRTNSIQLFQFPYTSFREGQRGYAGAVYKTIKNGKYLFAQAPTGIGKTMGSLFPAIKAMGNGYVDKLFYVTAKTSGRIVAEKTLFDMRIKGLRLKYVTLTAKEKICFSPEGKCDEKTCDYFKHYFFTISELLPIVSASDEFTRETIEQVAQKHMVCPFELSLDLSLFTDCVICDYNYIFDPQVYLRRYFDHISESYTFLVDEAHNLPDRARDMFSAKIEKKDIMSLKRITISKRLPFTRDLQKINSFFIKKNKEMSLTNSLFETEHSITENFLVLLKTFCKNVDKWLEKNIQNEHIEDIVALYFTCYFYIKMADLFDDHFISYFQKKHNGNIATKLYCMDPSSLLLQSLKRCKSAIFFSATLMPLDYFRRILINNTECNRVQIGSPFPSHNFGLFIYNSVSTKFICRERSYEKIAEIICAVKRIRPGNYIVYFPSYDYLNRVAEIVSSCTDNDRIEFQKPNMDELERTNFINLFQKKSDQPICAFAVMGGLFGEGIDLRGDMLIGVIIIGVGLPQLCFERDVIKKYFSGNSENGFSYAYQFPGFNRVMQAVGRVIRSENDKGIAVLIDERFSESRYTALYPENWSHYTVVNTEKELTIKIKKFWNN